MPSDQLPWWPLRVDVNGVRVHPCACPRRDRRNREKMSNGRFVCIEASPFVCCALSRQLSTMATQRRPSTDSPSPTAPPSPPRRAVTSAGIPTATNPSAFAPLTCFRGGQRDILHPVAVVFGVVNRARVSPYFPFRLSGSRIAFVAPKSEALGLKACLRATPTSR